MKRKKHLTREIQLCVVVVLNHIQRKWFREAELRIFYNFLKFNSVVSYFNFVSLQMRDNLLGVFSCYSFQMLVLNVFFTSFQRMEG